MGELKGDLVEVYKILHSVEKVNGEKPFSLSCIVQQKIQDRRTYLFAQYIINLPQGMVMTTDIDDLKGKIRQFQELRAIK